MESLAFVFLATVLVSAILAIVLVFVGFPMSDQLNNLARRIGLMRASPDTRSLGQEHAGEVTQEFSLDGTGERAIGKVVVRGEIWTAEGSPALVGGLQVGDRVRVTYGEKLVVRVVGKAL